MPDAAGNTKLGPAHTCRVVPGCFGPISSKGMCRRHYLQSWRYGDPRHREVLDLRAKTALELPAETIAYLAGLFDGEGCINCRIGKKARPYDVWLSVTISNTVRSVLDWAQSVLGCGQIYGYDNGTRRICYDLSLRSIHGERFLRTVLPFLRIKKNRAVLALAMRDTVHRAGSAPINSTIIQERQRLVALLVEDRHAA